MQKQKIFLFLAGFLLIPALAASYYFIAKSGDRNLATVKAESKTPLSPRLQRASKWQKLLENNGIDQAFWKKYLPKVKHKEYNKAMKKYRAAQINLPAGANVVAESAENSTSSYPLHKNIATTYFWAGEDASGDNYGISNNSSCWDESWDKSCKKENPFYFALPYNDFDDNGNRKAEALKVIPWASAKNWSSSESICKNQWIKIIHDGKVAYAQWEDAGPCDDAGGCGENDKNYVFGTAAPKFKIGLDVSPAVKDQLGLDDVDKTDWRFINENEVPAGPWKNVITRSGVNWD